MEDSKSTLQKENQELVSEIEELKKRYWEVTNFRNQLLKQSHQKSSFLKRKRSSN